MAVGVRHTPVRELSHRQPETAGHARRLRMLDLPRGESKARGERAAAKVGGDLCPGENATHQSPPGGARARAGSGASWDGRVRTVTPRASSVRASCAGRGNLLYARRARADVPA